MSWTLIIAAWTAYVGWVLGMRAKRADHREEVEFWRSSRDFWRNHAFATTRMLHEPPPAEKSLGEVVLQLEARSKESGAE